jgi:hypothetical protein
MSKQVDFSKFASVGVKPVAKAKDFTPKEPNAPASFDQKKLLSVIFKYKGMTYDWSLPITKGEASAMITEGITVLPPRQKQSRRGW